MSIAGQSYATSDHCGRGRLRNGQEALRRQEENPVKGTLVFISSTSLSLAQRTARGLFRSIGCNSFTDACGALSPVSVGGAHNCEDIGLSPDPEFLELHHAAD